MTPTPNRDQGVRLYRETFPGELIDAYYGPLTPEQTVWNEAPSTPAYGPRETTEYIARPAAADAAREKVVEAARRLEFHAVHDFGIGLVKGERFLVGVPLMEELRAALAALGGADEPR